MIDIKDLDFDKMGGLLPAVITDVFTGKVLMVGFMNKEAAELTLITKKVTFFSRSKNSIWVKGETSGNHLLVEDIKTDCDKDTLLIKAKPLGNTCHTGSYSCFNEEEDSFLFLQFLFNYIKKRKEEMPEGSYTTKLFKSGSDRIIQKVGEEAVETVIAAKNRDRHEIVNEVSDLFYHLFVMLVDQDINITEICDNLKSRHR